MASAKSKQPSIRKANGIPINIGISAKHRAKIAEGLSTLLGDTFNLYLKTHGFHWNVTGPMFNTLHTMFGTQYNELWLALDEVAERIRALGYPATATAEELLRVSAIKSTRGVPAAEEMIALLVDDHETAARTARELFPTVEEAHDEPTADLLTQRMNAHEKTAWMLRSMLEN